MNGARSAAESISWYLRYLYTAEANSRALEALRLNVEPISEGDRCCRVAGQPLRSETTQEQVPRQSWDIPGPALLHKRH